MVTGRSPQPLGQSQSAATLRPPSYGAFGSLRKEHMMELTEKELRQRGMETHHKKVHKWYEKYLIKVKLNYDYYAKTQLEVAISENSAISGSSVSRMVRKRDTNVKSNVNLKQIKLWHSDEEGNLVVSEKVKNEGE